MDENTRREIEKITNRLLKDTGLISPPFRINPLLEHLKLDRDYYSLDDPSFLRKVQHKIQVGAKKFLAIPKKIKLVALWFPDKKSILIDSSLHSLKIPWASFHELGHSIIPWHQEYFMGDTAQTLEPSFQELLEEEANFAASNLMFGGDLFTQEALDTSPEWKSIQNLKKRYETTFPVLLHRYIQFTHARPMAMITSTPSWKEIPSDQETRFRRFVASKEFCVAFPDFSPENMIPMINEDLKPQKHSSVVDEFAFSLDDIDGNKHEFYAETFFNTYNLITFMVHRTKMTTTRVVHP
jgi:Zn-dependent peptidase ImmA (M78 family)